MKVGKIQFYLNLAQTASTQSTCPRAPVGAVLVNDDRVVSIGYNGSPRGTPHCIDEGCLIYVNGTRESCFRATHAEVNVVTNAAYGGACTKNSILFCTHKPCNQCTKLLINAGITYVYYLYEYQDDITHKVIGANSIKLVQWLGEERVSS